MDITEFGFRLFLIFIPGIIAFIIVDALTVHDKTSPFFAILKSAVLGSLCYLSYYPISLLINAPFSFFDIIADNSKAVDFREVITVTLMSIPIGLIVSSLIYHKILFRIAHKLHISRKISDPGIWSHILGLDPRTLDTQWISIIDEQKNLLYQGFLQFYSDNNDPEHEYFLRNVKVFVYQDNAPKKLLYETPALYLNGNRERFKMEFPNVPYLPDPPEKKSKK